MSAIDALDQLASVKVNKTSEQKITGFVMPGCSDALVSNGKFSPFKYKNAPSHYLSVDAFVNTSDKDFVDSKNQVDAFAGYRHNGKFIPSPALERFYRYDKESYALITAPRPSTPYVYISSALHRIVSKFSENPFMYPCKEHSLVLVRIVGETAIEGFEFSKFDNDDCALFTQCLQFISGIPVMTNVLKDKLEDAKLLFKKANELFGSLVGGAFFDVSMIGKTDYWMDKYYNLVEKFVKKDFAKKVELKSIPQVDGSSFDRARSASLTRRSGSITRRSGSITRRQPEPEPESTVPRGRREEHERATTKPSRKSEFEFNDLASANAEIVKLREQLAAVKLTFDLMYGNRK